MITMGQAWDDAFDLWQPAGGAAVSLANQLQKGARAAVASAEGGVAYGPRPNLAYPFPGYMRGYPQSYPQTTRHAFGPFPAHYGGTLAGLGQSYSYAYDFKCLQPTSDCYGTKKLTEPPPGAVHIFFVNAQKQINRYAGLVGFAPLVPDGIIGSRTMAAAVKIAQYFTTRSTSAVAVVINAVATISMTAKDFCEDYINDFTTEIKKTADTLEAAGQLPGGPPVAVTPPVQPTTPGTAVAPVGPTPTPTPAPAPAPKKKSNAVWWIVGAVAVAGVAGVGTWAALRRRKRTSTEREFGPAVPARA